MKFPLFLGIKIVETDKADEQMNVYVDKEFQPKNEIGEKDFEKYL